MKIKRGEGINDPFPSFFLSQGEYQIIFRNIEKQGNVMYTLNVPSSGANNIIAIKLEARDTWKMPKSIKYLLWTIR